MTFNYNQIVLVTLLAMMSLAVGFPTIFTVEQSENDIPTYDFPFVSRAGWLARKPKLTLPLSTPVPFVVIHHSYQPPACKDATTCKQAMRDMQNFHMDDRGWWDIGYNFAVGGDGSAYEGRGWSTLGAHALHFNSVSLGICLIGDWSNEIPPAEQIKTAKAIIATGIELGYIKPDYKVVGHRQVRETECPGDALYKVIQEWDHYSPYPASKDDLLDMEEISDLVKEVMRGNASYTH